MFSDGYLDRVSEALELIHQYDPIRYRRLLRDVDRIWIFSLVGARGQFNFDLKKCSLDYRFVKSATIESIASTIVHEATHGHSCLRKFGYPETLRSRIENICMQQQLAFVRKLPAATHVMGEVERSLTRPASSWSDKTFNERRPDEVREALKSLGMPSWIIKFMLTIVKIRLRFYRKKG